MVMQRISLVMIEISLSDTPGIRVYCDRKDVPDGRQILPGVPRMRFENGWYHCRY
jgi:hypothetical protein